MKSLLIFLLSFTVVSALAQSRISGKVTDARTGEALPFVSVYIKNTNTGTTTDEHGTQEEHPGVLPIDQGIAQPTKSGSKREADPRAHDGAEEELQDPGRPISALFHRQ